VWIEKAAIIYLLYRFTYSCEIIAIKIIYSSKCCILETLLYALKNFALYVTHNQFYPISVPFTFKLISNCTLEIVERSHHTQTLLVTAAGD
jgi:hypothetical protein